MELFIFLAWILVIVLGIGGFFLILGVCLEVLSDIFKVKIGDKEY